MNKKFIAFVAVVFVVLTAVKIVSLRPDSPAPQQQVTESEQQQAEAFPSDDASFDEGRDADPEWLEQNSAAIVAKWCLDNPDDKSETCPQNR